MWYKKIDKQHAHVLDKKPGTSRNYKLFPLIIGGEFSSKIDKSETYTKNMSEKPVNSREIEPMFTGRPGDHITQSVWGIKNNTNLYGDEFSIERISKKDQGIMMRYWDAECDNLLTKVVHDNPKSFPVQELVDRVNEYLERTQKLAEFKQKTRRSNFPTHSEWLLREYCSYKLSCDGHYKIKRKRHICNGCGKLFSEMSIDRNTALKVEMNIQFCSFCYYCIFGHRFMGNTTAASKMPSEVMLGYLFDLSRLLQFIPGRSYMENIVILGFPSEKQIEIGKILLKMPAYDIYIERFGNWLKALSLAGVLDDGHRKTSRGIQCLANDGHVCLSLGEKAIDDWLSAHSIPHDKEVFYPFDEILNPNHLSRTDWKIGDVHIEFAGLMNSIEYADRIGKKKELASKYGLTLVIMEPKDLFELDNRLAFLV
jgi:hypothetical protein